MWLMTEFGFFSIVQKPDDVDAGTLTIRSRARRDLEDFEKRHPILTTPILETDNTDYRYRAKAKRKDIAKAMAAVTEAIDYSNFKSRVAKTQGDKRAGVYHDVWSALLPLQPTGAKKSTRVPASRASPKPSTGKISAGGILVDARKHVLLREPTGQFDGYVWTFAKGKVDIGKSLEDTALREVREETGYRAEIVAAIPGEFKGGTGVTVYFLMRPKGEPGKHDNETSSIRWVGIAEARKLIAKTTNIIGQERDLAVLAAAEKLIADL
jgi:8-oxo-dGTP pyrophosphatase MutT (NUDIX family)